VVKKKKKKKKKKKRGWGGGGGWHVYMIGYMDSPLLFLKSNW